MSEYVNQSLQLIESFRSDIDALGLDQLYKIKDELLHNFEVGQIFRSRWEMENSVLNDVKFPTPDAKYWQAVREQQVHFQELTMLAFEYRKTAARINLLDAKMSNQNVDQTIQEQNARAELLQIEIERLQYLLINQARTAKDRIREILSWHDIMQRLKPLMKHSIENYEDHQAESYALRFQKERLIAQNNPTAFAEMRNLTALHQMAEKNLQQQGVNRRRMKGD